MAESIKTEWPELVGKGGLEAKATIAAQSPHLEVECFPEDGMFTMDFREGRVRILVGADGIVSQTPRIG